MLHRFVGFAVFALVAVGFVQMVNKSLSRVYLGIGENVKEPYAKAQHIYDKANSTQ